MFSRIEKDLIGKSAKFIGATETQIIYGGNADPREHLVEGQSYEIVSAKIGQSSTALTLKGFENLTFNSVCFIFDRSSYQKASRSFKK